MQGWCLSSTVVVWLLAGTVNGQSGSGRRCNNPVPGLDKMTNGIDITTFDLFSTSQEGLKYPVIEFTCDQGRVKRIDGVDYELPDQIISITDLPGGMANTRNTLVTSYSQARQTIAANFGVSGNWAKFGFSSSASLERMQNAITEQSSFVSVVSASESARKAFMLTYFRLHAGSDLQDYVDHQLASDFNPREDSESAETYRELIRIYGTHFFASANFGGFMMVETQTQNEYLQHHSTLEARAQAEATFFSIFTVTGGARYETANVDNQYTNMSSKLVRYFGGMANLMVPDGLQEWLPTVNQRPWLFKGRLVPISRLIRDNGKRQALVRAVEDYMLRASLEEMSRLLSASPTRRSLELHHRVNTFKTFPLLTVGDLQALMDEILLLEPAFGDRCRDGWEAFRGSCYKLQDQALTWDSAQINCSSMGAHVVWIDSEEENAFVASMIRDSGMGIWLGLARVASDWEWTNGHQSFYYNWNAGEPNNAGGNENCVQMLSQDGLWNDDVCSKTARYVCKR